MKAIEPLESAIQFTNILWYIRLRAEERIPINPRVEDFLAGRPLREDDGVFVPVAPARPSPPLRHVPR